MTQEERRIWLIRTLQKEVPEFTGIQPPEGEAARKAFLRSLFNLREPKAAGEEFLKIQNEYLQQAIAQKKITDISDLSPLEPGIYLWQGDITTLRCDAIVNAANSQLLGCFCPCHGCIDNAIHTYAGVQLRLACAELMQRQGHSEAVGQAKITPAFNLPCRYVLHTVGPFLSGKPTVADEKALASCYRSCLALAEQTGVRHVAFCCISTGEFHFPNRLAAEIAVRTVREYLARTQSKMEVIFNVFKDNDYEIYRELLGADPSAEAGAGRG